MTIFRRSSVSGILGSLIRRPDNESDSCFPFFLFFLVAAQFPLPMNARAQTDAGPAILHATKAAKILPNSVFFRGKSATTQARNAAGNPLFRRNVSAEHLVDTSGYSTAVQEKYQACLLTEVSLQIEGHLLPPGAYVVGFTGDEFHVMDIGNHELLHASSARDTQMQRPIPLQVLEETSGGIYRICFGRQCVRLRRAH